MRIAPNFIFIMADDHAAKAISAYGAGINHTPNLDRLASEGARLDHCYVTNSICTPSRATVLTGTHNHVSGVLTLNDEINNRMPNVAKQFQSGGYQTALFGKWHLGEGPEHEPTGFDHWSIVPGQGVYFDPDFITMGKTSKEEGYATDIITNKTIDWLEQRDLDRPFYAMVHHKAPHRSWENDPKHDHLYTDPIKLPDTFNDDYKNRANAAQVAEMRVADDLTYGDLNLAQPGGGDEVGELLFEGSTERKIPNPTDVSSLRLIDRQTGEAYTFDTQQQLAEFKFQRYMQRYLRTVQSVDDNVGRLLDYIDADPELKQNTMIVYTSDQGFFLGEHGWFDKRFMYEESFQMPFLVRYPAEVEPGSVIGDIVQNVDFAPTFLDIAGIPVPSYMQGSSFRKVLQGQTPADWQKVAYHRYWMHNDGIHHAYAHYGVRDSRYKLIYWYNESFNLTGTGPGSQDREWELFDTQKDPFELFNVFEEAEYQEIRKELKLKLEVKMLAIGDQWVHDGSDEWQCQTGNVSAGLQFAKRSQVNG
jgi:arylsulfatase A-like enzyme